jgi:hypothetical protein
MVQRFVSTFYKHAHAVVPKSELSATKMGLLAAASSILPLNESDLPGLAFLTIGELLSTSGVVRVFFQASPTIGDIFSQKRAKGMVDPTRKVARWSN